MRNAKKAFFGDLIKENSNTAPIWRAMNAITNKSRRSQSTPAFKHSPDEYNQHFLSIADNIMQTSNSNNNTSHTTQYEITPPLRRFCRNRLKASDSAEIPEIAVHEVGEFIMKMKNKKSMGQDSINSTLLKLSLPYTVESLTCSILFSLDFVNITHAPQP